ncbi:MAG: hypothetical protein J6X44_13560 [Thermoguttaceae bacterium]|nr:hypothetical protein [Thermoguttaceae bacterium]
MIIPYYCEDYPEDPPAPYSPTPKKNGNNKENKEKQPSTKLPDKMKTDQFNNAKPQSEIKNGES